jgi:hypothetical protein
VRARRIVVATLLAACGDNVPAIELADLHAETVRARCDRAVRCGLVTAHETCVAYFRTPDEDDLYAAIEAGVIRYDGASALRCLEALAALPCDETSREVRAPIEACDRMLRGTREVGEACAFDRECASGSCDAPVCPSDSCCTGACLATRFAAAGAPCTADEECVPGTFCGGQGACTPLAARAEPCRLDAHCEDGLACIGASELQDGACRALPLLGESCPYRRCAELGAICNSAQLCVPVGLPGAPCTTGADCSPLAVCGPSNLCIDVPHLGAPCGFECAGEAWCRDGTCVAPVENTAPCTADNQCASLYCQEGVVFEQCADRPICF